MKDTSALNNYPKTQIKPFDGMSVTAETWAQAHEEHRLKMQSHDLFFHGSGIVYGLEVVANDPPDQYVFISPGMAVDPAGNVIILTEPVAYDFGSSMEGELFLMLGHGEREIMSTQNDIRYLQNEFMIAARPSMPKRPAVELARVTLSHRGNAIKNAGNPAHPNLDEIDMRYRTQIKVDEKQIINVGICGIGEEPPSSVLTGWDYLARECRRTLPYELIVDGPVPITSDFSKHDILYFAASGAFKVEAAKIKEISSLLEQGKALIAEAMDEAADESFKAFFGKLGVNLKPVADYDSILKTPHLFNAPPEGNQGSKVLLGNRVIYSSAKYCLAWSGKVLGGTGSRADIRSALEWGLNMIEFCK